MSEGAEDSCATRYASWTRRPATALAPRASRSRFAPPSLSPSPCSLVFVARLGDAADVPGPQCAAHLARLDGGYAGQPSPPALRRLRARPSAGAYTAYHAYTTSAHSEVWEACAVYAPAERARAQAFPSDGTKEGDGLGKSRGKRKD
ncbi:hypothetical protein EV715DRAFT_298130 [Schizophyllum commune]